MATLPRLHPVSDGTATTMAAPVGATTYWDAVNDYATAAAHDEDVTYITSGLDSSGSIFLGLTDMPTDFQSMDTLTISCVVKLQGTRTDDTTQLYAQAFAANGTTALSDEVLVTDHTTGGTYTVDSTSLTGIVGTKIDWDGAQLRLRWVFTKTGKSDGIALRVTAAYLDGTYTVAAPYEPPPATPYSDAVMADAPIAYWRMEETTGSVVTDLVSQRQGAVSGVNLNTDLGLANLASGGSWDAVDDYIKVPYSADLYPSQFSAECWVYRTANASNILRVMNSTGTGNGWGVWGGDGAIELQVVNAGGAIQLVHSTTMVNTLRHLVVTYDGTTARMYVDGVEVLSGTGSYVPTPDSAFYIGNRSDFARTWAGKIDEVSLYNKALTPAQVKAHYDAGYTTAPIEKVASDGLTPVLADVADPIVKTDVVTPKAETLTDDFSTQDTTKWAGWDAARYVDTATGELVIEASGSYPSLGAADTYDVLGSHFGAHITQLASTNGTSAGTIVKLSYSAGNFIELVVNSNGSYTCRIQVDTVNTDTYPGAVAGMTHARIRVGTDRTIFWEVFDGTTWTTLAGPAGAVVPAAWDATAMRPMLQAGYYTSTETLVNPARFTSAGIYETPLVVGPNTNILFGAGTPNSPGSTDQTELTGAAGREAQIDLWYRTWVQNITAADLDLVYARGQYSELTWEAFDPALTTADNAKYSYANILLGNHDAYIRNQAIAIRDWGKELHLRVFHEMNGDWYPWSIGVNGNTAAEHINAWKHIQAIFDSVGATNVKWLWSPNVSYTGSAAYSTIYPGDANVDIIAFDGYNWGDGTGLATNPGTVWQTPQQVFDASLNEMRALNTTRPFWIGETASAEAGGSKAEWIDTFIKWMTNQPEMEAFVWFHHNKERDWRISSTVASSDGFKASITNLDNINTLFGNDVVAVSVAESNSFETVSVAGSDDIVTSLEDSSGIENTGLGSDNATVGFTELAEIFIEYTASDSLAPSINDESDTRLDISASDGVSTSIADSASPIDVVLSGEEAIISTLSESTDSLVGSSASDTLVTSILDEGSFAPVSVSAEEVFLPTLLESTDFSPVTVSGSDDVAANLTDSSSLQSDGLGSDTVSVSVTESAEVFIEYTASDNIVSSIEDNGVVQLEISSSDSITTSIDDLSSAPVVSGVSEVASPEDITSSVTDTSEVTVINSASDFIASSLGEVATVDSTSLGEDILSVGLSEATETLVESGTSDSIGTNINDVSSVTLILESTDTATAGVDDVSTAPVVSGVNEVTSPDSIGAALAEDSMVEVIVSGVDSVATSISDLSSIDAGLSASDTLSASLTEQISFSAVQISGSDTVSASTTEEAGVNVDGLGADTFTPLLTEVSEVIVSISTNDTTTVSVAESSIADVSPYSSDDIVTGISEESSIFLTLDSTDTVSTTITEVSNPSLSVTASDAVDIVIVDASTLPITEVSASDAVVVGFVETALAESIIITVAITSSDDLNVMILLEDGKRKPMNSKLKFWRDDRLMTGTISTATPSPHTPGIKFFNGKDWN